LVRAVMVEVAGSAGTAMVRDSDSASWAAVSSGHSWVTDPDI